MKTLSIAVLAASSLVVSTAPASARIGEVVSFSYTAKELDSESSRDVLLKRMRAATAAACEGKRSEAYINAAECEKDLEEQFLAAISHPQLIAQNASKPVRIARSGK